MWGTRTKEKRKVGEKGVLYSSVVCYPISEHDVTTENYFFLSNLIKSVEDVMFPEEILTFSIFSHLILLFCLEYHFVISSASFDSTQIVQRAQAGFNLII